MIIYCGPGIATELLAGRSWIESRWGRDFPPVQTDPGAHPASCKMGTGSFPRLKCGRGVLLTTHPLLVPRSWKSRAIPLPTLWATPGLKRDHFTFNFYIIIYWFLLCWLSFVSFCCISSKHLHIFFRQAHFLYNSPYVSVVLFFI